MMTDRLRGIKRKTARLATLVPAVLVAVLLSIVPGGAHAITSDVTVTLNIAAGTPPDVELFDLAGKAHLRLRASGAEGRTTPALQGTYRASQAFWWLLYKSGLSFDIRDGVAYVWVTAEGPPLGQSRDPGESSVADLTDLRQSAVATKGGHLRSAAEKVAGGAEDGNGGEIQEIDIQGHLVRHHGLTREGEPGR